MQHRAACNPACNPMHQVRACSCTHEEGRAALYLPISPYISPHQVKAAQKAKKAYARRRGLLHTHAKSAPPCAAVLRAKVTLRRLIDE